MEVSTLTWILTFVGIGVLLAFDFIFHVRKAHVPTLAEAAKWSAIYIGLAILFGIGLWFVAGGQYGKEYFGGYITEKALSVDNLFVFLVIIGSFKVPRADQQKVLLFGIVVALIARSAFIFAGAALINRFAAVFYVFGLVLLLTAGNLLKPDDHDDDRDNVIVRLCRKVFHTTDYYDGDKLFTVVDGKRHLTPMLDGDGRDRWHRYSFRA